VFILKCEVITKNQKISFMDINNIQYWQNKYQENSTGWDLGQVSPPLKAYFDQVKNKHLKILIPGSGNAHEAEYLHRQGFTNVYVIDWAVQAIDNFQKRLPDFPKKYLFVMDFFKIEMHFDLIIEQTFFCALTPDLRTKYVSKMHELLQPKGKLVGLMFQIPLNDTHPPFGACKEEYLDLFQDKFTIKTMETAHNSIAPRKDSELFIIMQAI
jgi:SAM-dependent methyltransferase